MPELEDDVARSWLQTAGLADIRLIAFRLFALAVAGALVQLGSALWEPLVAWISFVVTVEGALLVRRLRGGEA